MSDELTPQTLERAIENDELILYYQPKISLLDGSIVGAEALVRWKSGEGEFVPPTTFIPIAESSGLLHDLTVRLLGQVVNASAELKKQTAGLALSINVAPNDLQSNTIGEHVAHYLDSQVIEPQDLQIEITESAVMGSFDQIKEGILQLTNMGINVMMDDFGTGYSSIDRLSQIPFSALKLDQGVVKRMGESRQNLNVVHAAISMARELRMTSVAEGVEDEASYHYLMVNGCQEAQGYFISRPISLAELVGFANTDHDFEGSQIGRIHQTVQNVLFHRKRLFDIVYCTHMGAKTCLPSIVDPDITDSLEKSRLGYWYFGVGQRLKGLAAFDALEQPIRDLHKLGCDILDITPQDTHNETLETSLGQMDVLVNRVVSLLHSLESHLLLTQNH